MSWRQLVAAGPAIVLVVKVGLQAVNGIRHVNGVDDEVSGTLQYDFLRFLNFLKVANWRMMACRLHMIRCGVTPTNLSSGTKKGSISPLMSNPTFAGQQWHLNLYFP